MGSLLLIELLGTPIVLAILVWIAQPARNPLGTLVRAWRWVFGSPSGRRMIALLAVVVGINVLQSSLDPRISGWLGYDLTPWVQSIEGDAVARLQALLLPITPTPVRFALTVFYLAGFVATLLLPLTLFHGDAAEQRTIRNTWIAALVANYILALPFYCFFPVAEIGWFEGSGVRPIIEELLPGLTAALRGGSALDNCFPSLHVSCTIAAWWCALRLGRKGCPTLGLSRAANISAALTAIAVLLLGVHWLSDVVAGLVFGIACAEIGLCYSASQRAALRA
ncbi:MAG: membrane-associated phospholipid phosphatase [Planctomycetota bacterium]|jgi:membrane-associated phospholipid phosphatase